MNRARRKYLLDTIKEILQDKELTEMLREAFEPTSSRKHGNASTGVSVGNTNLFTNGETPGEGHASGHEVWLKAKEVGERLHQSSHWVRERITLLPTDYVRKAKTGRGKPAWLLHPESITLLNQYR